MKPVKSLLFIIGLFVQTTLFSQITILASKTEGCDTLTVAFSYTVNPPMSVTSVRWEFGPGLTTNIENPICKYNAPGVYDVKVVLNNTDSVIYEDFIKICQTSDSIHVPNVFTPNGDKQNDELKVISNGQHFIKFQVFSKSGMLVYKTTAKTIVWDGKMSSGEDVPAGLYYYIAEPDDSSVAQKGFIYIYR